MPDWTESQIADAIVRYWSGCAWLRQLRIGVGYGADSERTIDLWGIWPARSRMFERVAIEIKVSASDFSRELAKPEKRMCIRAHVNRFYFAAPKGVINPARVPDGCGLIEVVRGTGEYTFINIAKPAIFTETNRPTWNFVAALARRLVKEEARA